MTFFEKSSLVCLNFKLRNSRSLECRLCTCAAVSLIPIFYYQQPPKYTVKVLSKKSGVLVNVRQLEIHISIQGGGRGRMSYLNLFLSRIYFPLRLSIKEGNQGGIKLSEGQLFTFQDQ